MNVAQNHIRSFKLTLAIRAGLWQ